MTTSVRQQPKPRHHSSHGIVMFPQRHVRAFSTQDCDE
jgi:hypothetical protein